MRYVITRNTMDNRPIGFFDSGLGGLTSMPYMQRKLPKESIVYYGDTARTPYGSKSIETIKKFSFQISDYLVSHDVKMIVIACNTISATCLDALRERHPDIPIIGIVSPIAKKISLEETEEVNIGVIGTKATIKSGVYENLITESNTRVNLFSLACPLFVPIIEEGIIEGEITELTIKYYLDDFIKDNDLKKIIMGCTHYPIISKTIKKLYPDIELINPSQELVEEVNRVLIKEKLLSDNELDDVEHLCFASDLSNLFIDMIDKVFDDSDTVKVNFKKFED